MGSVQEWEGDTNSTNLHELPGKWIDRAFCGWFDSGVRDEEIVKTVLNQPYVTRIYPSPRTGEEISVRVKEVALVDSPDDYVERRFASAVDLGLHLLPTDIRGSRAWSVEENTASVAEFGKIPREHPWMEIWEIETTNQIAVLDLIMFTEFYTDRTMSRFEVFSRLVLPLIEKNGAVIRAASGSGVRLVVNGIGEAEWRGAAGQALNFNGEFFSVERPRAELLKMWRQTKTLWFGYC